MKRIAAIGFGAMGGAIASALRQAGAEVISPLQGRSAETRQRAAAAGIQNVDLTAVAEAELILSIVPPSEAPGVARQVAEVIKNSSSSALFVDCNSVSPNTMATIANSFGEKASQLMRSGCGKAHPYCEASIEHCCCKVP